MVSLEAVWAIFKNFLPKKVNLAVLSLAVILVLSAVIFLPRLDITPKSVKPFLLVWLNIYIIILIVCFICLFYEIFIFLIKKWDERKLSKFYSELKPENKSFIEEIINKGCIEIRRGMPVMALVNYLVSENIILEIGGSDRRYGYYKVNPILTKVVKNKINSKDRR